MLGTKEYYELIAAFENDMRKHERINLRLDKDKKEGWSKGRIYESIAANDMFSAYQAGYAFGKWAGRD